MMTLHRERWISAPAGVVLDRLKAGGADSRREERRRG